MIQSRWVSCGLRAALALFMALALLAQAASAKELEYAYPDQSVWTTRLDKQGEPDNPLLRLAEAMFAKAGISWRAKSYPAARLFSYLADGNAQFSMLVKSPALEACCLFSKRPVATTELRVYRRSGTLPILAKEDLTGREVITIHGYSYAGLLNYIKDPANRVGNNSTVSHESAFVMLERRRADYLIDYAGPATEVLAEHPIKDLEYDVISRLDVHLVLARSYPDAEAVMGRLEAIAEGFTMDGTPKPQGK